MKSSKSPIKTIKLLHLYHDLMNLYGDWGNVDILARALTERGCRVQTDKKSVGDDVDVSAYDFIYIGSGTERSQQACMRDLAQYNDTLLKSVENRVFMLATGNSHELFGRAITDAYGERYETLGLLDFETIQKETRVTGDCVFKASFIGDRLIGFINRAGGGQDGEIKRPFTAMLGPGANDDSRGEGIMYKNLLGTYLTGPVLVRNPPLLKYFAGQLAGEGHIAAAAAATYSGAGVLFSAQEAAYRMALSELSAR